eukprot:2177098-Pleurochrysis_carterae.AAC.1
MGSVAAVLHLGRHDKRRLEERAELIHLFLDDGLLEALYDDRGKIRSDKVPQERIDWLVNNCWCSDEHTRESEAKKDEIFDPASRADDRDHRRLRWVEMPLLVFYSYVQRQAALRWNTKKKHVL